MTIYQGPSREHSSYFSKFVRVGDIVVVTPPGDIDTMHSELAQTDGVHEDVLSIKIKKRTAQ